MNVLRALSIRDRLSVRETDKMSLSSVPCVGHEHRNDEKQSRHTIPELVRILNVIYDPNVHCQHAVTS